MALHEEEVQMTMSEEDFYTQQKAALEEQLAQLEVVSNRGLDVDDDEDLQASRRGGKKILINAALRRIQEGSYGDCDDCGCEIPQARLEASPTVRLCISCQSKVEKRDKRSF